MSNLTNTELEEKAWEAFVLECETSKDFECDAYRALIEPEDQWHIKEYGDDDFYERAFEALLSSDRDGTLKDPIGTASLIIEKELKILGYSS